MNPSPIIQITNLCHAYKTRKALENVTFSVSQGEIFGLLGPNGSGKTTLFRILSTAFPPTSGRVLIQGREITEKAASVRKEIGVVFQSPSVDSKLTVWENLRHQGHLYGTFGQALKTRSEEMLTRLGLLDRAGELAEKLSGGLKRRVELAKGLLHHPGILILDEPSTGLDPGARLDLWKYLKGLREKERITILLTTHLMEEAENCDRIGILNHGKLVTLGTPEALKREIGGDVLHVKARDAASLAGQIKERFKADVILIDGELQIEHEKGHRFITELVEAFPGKIDSVTFRKPTLEDVFNHKTGHRFWNEGT
jgi:ABC-2 type transport system ATP-binding protein